MPRHLALPLAGVAAAATLAFIWATGIEGPNRVAILAVAVIAHLALVLGRPDRDALPAAAVLGLSVVVVVGAVAARPQGTDLWAYQMYGRAVVVHDASPYEHPPEDFPDDPVLQRMRGSWVGTRAEYGPALVGTAVVIARLTGTHEVGARLAWQGLSGAAVLGAGVLLHRRTGSGLAMAAVGLNPLVGYHLVNLAHNDAVIGLAVLGAVVLADDDHDVGAALLLTVAALVKAPTGIGLLALLLWIGHRKGWFAAARAGLAAAVLGGAAVAVAGGRAALEPMLGARGRANGYTPWNLLRRGGTEVFRGNSMPDLPFTVGSGLATAALAASVAGALAVAAARTWRPHAGDVTGPLDGDEPTDRFPTSAGPAVAGALVMWTLLSLYTSPWSFGWVLPVLALHLRSRLTHAVLAYVALFTVAAQWGILTVGATWLEQPGAATYDDVNAVARSLLLVGLLAIVVGLALDAARRTTAGRPRRPGAAPAPAVSDETGRSAAVPGPR